MPDALHTYWQQQLSLRTATENYRYLKSTPSGIDFYSNDYLGMVTCNRLQVSQKANGATGSRLLSGNSPAAMQLEQFLAAHHETEAALLFNSGYVANLGLLAAIANRHTYILYDELCHASMIDGIRLSHTKAAYRFAHNNPADLEEKLLKYAPQGPVIILVEAIYSMEGSCAPLHDVADLARRFDAALIVDEAHTTGVIGAKGCGLVQHLGLQNDVTARIHTFGKALGAHGAAVVGSRLLVDYLVNFSRPFIYTTALPSHALEVIRQAYAFMTEHPEEQNRLQERISYFCAHKKDTPYGHWLSSSGPIQSLCIKGGNEAAKTLARRLEQNGLLAAAILHPTVPKDRERIRFCLHSFNTENDIDFLFEQLNK